MVLRCKQKPGRPGDKRTCPKLGTGEHKAEGSAGTSNRCRPKSQFSAKREGVGDGWARCSMQIEPEGTATRKATCTSVQAEGYVKRQQQTRNKQKAERRRCARFGINCAGGISGPITLTEHYTVGRSCCTVARTTARSRARSARSPARKFVSRPPSSAWKVCAKSTMRTRTPAWSAFLAPPSYSSSTAPRKAASREGAELVGSAAR